MELIKFECNIGGKDLYVNPNKINYIETDDEKSIIYFDNGRQVSVTQTSDVIMGIFHNANIHNKK